MTRQDKVEAAIENVEALKREAVTRGDQAEADRLELRIKRLYRIWRREDERLGGD